MFATRAVGLARSSMEPSRPRPAFDVPESFDYEADRRAAKSKNIAIGLVLLVIGIIVTAVTYDSASREGGTYIVAWGPMVFGAIRLFKGLAG
jgi:hypothetical protein